MGWEGGGERVGRHPRSGDTQRAIKVKIRDTCSCILCPFL